jgi:hypothetical protein
MSDSNSKLNRRIGHQQKTEFKIGTKNGKRESLKSIPGKNWQGKAIFEQK